MSIKSAANTPVNVIGKIMLFLQLGDLHLRVNFSVADNLAVPLRITMSFIDRFVKGIFLMERRIIPIQSRLVAIISGHSFPSHPLAVQKNDSNAGTDTDFQQGNKARTPLFSVAI